MNWQNTGILIFIYVRAPVREGVLPGWGGVPRGAAGAGADSESSSHKPGADNKEPQTTITHLGSGQQNQSSVRWFFLGLYVYFFLTFQLWCLGFIYRGGSCALTPSLTLVTASSLVTLLILASNHHESWTHYKYVIISYHVNNVLLTFHVKSCSFVFLLCCLSI